MDVTDILDSDQRILAHSKREGSVISFDWGDGSPPLQGALPSEINLAVVTQWCEAVRSTYRERKDRQEAEAHRSAAVVRGAPDRADSSTALSSGSGLPVETSVESVKASLEQGIEASLTQLGRRRAAAEERIEALTIELQSIRNHVRELNKSIRYYERLREKL